MLLSKSMSFYSRPNISLRRKPLYAIKKKKALYLIGSPILINKVKRLKSVWKGIDLISKLKKESGDEANGFGSRVEHVHRNCLKDDEGVSR